MQQKMSSQSSKMEKTSESYKKQLKGNPQKITEL
jgi:hypothetical protein